jgi:hypothetical protein
MIKVWTNIHKLFVIVLHLFCFMRLMETHFSHIIIDNKNNVY